MRALLIALLLSLPAHAEWTERSVIGVRTDNSKAPIAIFINTHSGYGKPSGVWHTLDVTQFGVHDCAVSIFLSGILIISHGTKAQTCDLTIAFRAPGDTIDPGNYIGQTIEPWIGGGERSNMSTWVPVKDGKIEYQWNRSSSGKWPDECAYGINLSLQAYLR